MSDLFHDPRKPWFLSPFLSNEYENPEYTFKGDVDSFIYKKWRMPPGPFDGMESFSVPDEQFYIELNNFGKPYYIETQKEWMTPRRYIGNKYYMKPGIEQPISYYQQFYSGGTTFIYDEKNRLIEIVSDVKLNGDFRNNTKKEFFYDVVGNSHVKSEAHTFTYNESGQLTVVTYCQESDEYYEKWVFEYDDEGRIIKKMEYGYFSEYDEGTNKEIIRLDKGILLLTTIEYRYTRISPNEIQCISALNAWHEKEKNHLKSVVVFDNHGFKKYRQSYDFDGNLSETSYYNYVFDENGNWIKATNDVAFGTDKIIKNYSIYERDINYRDHITNNK